MGNKESNSLLFIVLIGFSQLYSVKGTACGGLQGDVMFVLDSSGSVGPSNFQKMLDFVNDLIDDFDIGPSNVRVGLVRYDDDVDLLLYLDDHLSKATLKNAVSAVAYTGGGNEDNAAIDMMTYTGFTAARGDRPSITNVGIYITDGQQTGVRAATRAKAAGVRLFAIGIGTSVTALNAVASHPVSDHVFTVSSFSGLASIKGAFQAKACIPAVFNGNVMVGSQSSTPTTTAASTTTSLPSTRPTTVTTMTSEISRTKLDTAAIAVLAVGAAVATAVVAAVVYRYLTRLRAARAAVAATNGGARPQDVLGKQSDDVTAFPDFAAVPKSVLPTATRLPAGP